jgi:stringent starvation protein B
VKSSRPYLLRALYEWIVDNGCTPHIIVDAELQGVDVPREYVKDGQIVLNLSPTAVIELQLADDAVSFNGRFGGRPVDIHIPMNAVLGVYARENGQGMAFEQEENEPPDGDDGGSSGGDKAPTPLRPGGGRPSLKVVK